MTLIDKEIEYNQDQIEVIIYDNQTNAQNFKFTGIINSVQFEVANQEYVMTHSHGHYSDVESVHWCIWDVEILHNPKTDKIDIFRSYVDEDGNILAEDKMDWHELFKTEEDFWAFQDHMIQLSKLEDQKLVEEVMA